MCQIRAFVAIFAFLQCGYALKCWICNSAIDVNCKDYFNVTRLKQNRLYHENYLNNQYGNVQPVINEPHLEYCEQKQNPPSDYKYVCLKTMSKDTNPSGFPTIKRECRMVPMAFKEGYCPEDIHRLDTTQFCSTCQYDGCNSANGRSRDFFLAILLPLVVLAALKE